jgi:hypothetical protein
MRTTLSLATSKKKGSCSVWDRLRKQVTLERQQLHRLLETYRPLIERCAVSPPDDIELAALAAMLHSL